MEVTLIDHTTLTLTPEEEENPDFQRGLEIAKKKAGFRTTHPITEATFIGFWAGIGQNVGRSAENVRNVLRKR